MTKHTEVMKLALEALVKALPDMPVHTDWHLEAITALREALTSVPDWASEAKEQPAKDEFKAAYIEAMVASNEAGFAGVSAAETIRELSRMVAEQPAQQEPVAWMWRCKPYCGWPEWSVSLKRPADSGRDGHRRTEGYEDVALYTSPPASKPLTLGQKQRLWSSVGDKPTLKDRVNAYGTAIEAAHGIKGDA